VRNAKWKKRLTFFSGQVLEAELGGDSGGGRGGEDGNRDKHLGLLGETLRRKIRNQGFKMLKHQGGEICD